MTLSKSDFGFAPAPELFSGAKLPEPSRISPLRIEASARRYYRISFPEFSPISSAVLCQDTPIPDIEADDFLLVRKNLEAAGISVPALYSLAPEKGQMLLEDGGDEDLNHVAENRTEKRESLLLSAIALMASFHNVEPFAPVKKRAFDFDKLYWEMEFLLERIRLRFSDSANTYINTSLRQALQGLCRELDAPDSFVPVHRDFHGRNILVAGERLILIDFQDARMGLREYDLASLLYDPYADWSLEEKRKAIEYYEEFAEQQISRTRLQRQTAQRLLKALGSYFYLSYEKGMRDYRPFINKTILSLLALTDEPGWTEIRDFLIGVLALETKSTEQDS